mmetsp:Transcript_2712/g.5821  ORF Transcript_2712/g.5821 Transcript_2712/m.5821 type:complete len:225 (-) Transcript_2712:1576-2250(-)
MVSPTPRPVLRGKRNSSYSRLLANTEKEELNSSLSRLCNEKNQPPLDNHCRRSTTRKNRNNELEMGLLDSRDPDNDVSSPVPLDVGGLSRFQKKRDTGSCVNTKKCTTHKGLRKKSRQQRQCTSRRHSHSTRTPNERVSFAVGDNGNAVTSVNHYRTYSDAEKAACFYNDREIRRFRSEHYLGIIPECSKQQSSGYETAAKDFLSVVNDMWNSFLDMAYSSLHG